MKSIYAGNLPYDATQDDVRVLFEQFGAVGSVTLVNDRISGKPRGFGFVEMSGEAADVAMRELDGKNFNGGGLRVNEARRRERGGRGPGHARRGPGHYRG